MNGGRPQQMGLREVIAAFCEFRKDVIIRRTTYLLSKARDRAHILAGLMVALASIDRVIEMIKQATDTETARRSLCVRPTGRPPKWLILLR